MLGTIFGIARIGIGMLLALAAYGKLAQDFGRSVDDVLGYRLVGRRMAIIIATVLPAAELVLAGCLILGVYPRALSAAAALLFAAFAVSGATTVRRGIKTECGCFGALARQRVGIPLVVRNTFFALVLLLASLLPSGRQLSIVHNQPEVLGILGVLGLITAAAQIGRQARHVAL